MFPGEDKDPLDLGATFRDLLEFAIPSGAQSREYCVTNFHLYPNIPSEEDSVDSLLGTITGESWQVATSNFILQDSNDETIRVTVNITRERDGTTTLTKENGFRSYRHLSCEDYRSSPWPNINFTEALEHAREHLPPGHLMMFSHNAQSRLDWQEPETGWHTYRFGVGPESDEGAPMLFSLYELTFGSTSERLFEDSNVPPDYDWLKEG